MFTVEELENKDKPKEIKKKNFHHSSLQDNVLTF